MRLRVIWKNGWAHLDGSGPDGRRIRRSLKTRDPKRAEEARAQTEARLWKVNVYGPDAVYTFDECALAYAEDGGEARFLMPVTKAFVGRKLRDITPKEIRDAARKTYPNASPATRNRQFIIPARAVINYGHSQGWCAPIRVEAFAVEKPKRQTVDRSYLDKLRPHMPEHAFALLLFLHTTGRRVGDATGLTPADVDLENRVAVIGKTKNGDPAIAHLTKEVAELISGLEPRHGLVFGYVDRSGVYSALRRACKRADMPYLGTHQIGRHSFNTALHNAGFSIPEIGQASGAKSLRLLSETYIHPNESGARAAQLFDKNPARSKKQSEKNNA